MRRLIPLLALVLAAGSPLFAQGGSAPYAPENQLEAQVERVGRDAGPSVVNITSTMITQGFFNQPIPQQAVGSGFVFDERGDIVTNYHVVENANSVMVTLRTGQSYKAKVIGTDPSTDLAVIRVDAPNLPPPLVLGDSDRVQVGEFVVALGNPFGLSHTLTFGVISAKGRVIKSPNGRYVGEALQTDTPINPGNSGGPLITLGGKVIGINSQIISPSGSSAGIGFAIPANLVREIVPQLIASGRAEHPYLGIQAFDLTPQIASLLRSAGVSVPVEHGVMVATVAPGSPAQQAGLQPATQALTYIDTEVPVGGDIIVAIDGTPIPDFESMSAYLQSEAKVGETVTLTIYRNGTKQDVPVTLGSSPQT